MEFWVPLTIAAAFAQNARTALQKHLQGRLSIVGAAYTRFFYAVPFAVLYVGVLVAIGELPIPDPHLQFLGFVVLGAITQVMATLLLLYLFSLRNFTVANTYARTETVQAAIFGAVILGDMPTLNASIGIVVSLIGVIIMSIGKHQRGWKTLVTSWFNKGAITGLLTGAGFGIAAVSYRGASLSLGGGEASFLMPAAFTLVCATLIQLFGVGVIIAIREPLTLVQVVYSWKTAVWIGLAGTLASAGWFTAMTVQTAAYVKALAQVEVVFSYTTSVLFFRERITLIEVVSVALVVTGILLLLM